MPDDLFPQAREMADESMVRNLAAQASAIWPQELALFDRYGLTGPLRILDAGCGTGEISSRLARRYPGATVLGVDILDPHLELARRRHADLAPRLAFEHRSVYDLGVPERSFDLVVCRHLVQSIPDPARVLSELARAVRPGGRLHVIAEDYGMIHFPRRALDPGELWGVAPARVSADTGVDMFVGRRAYGLLRALGLREISVDYVVVDPLRVPRETFAAIWAAWRDGYADTIARHTGMTRERVVALFDDQIATILDPASYAAWIVPVVAGIAP